VLETAAADASPKALPKSPNPPVADEWEQFWRASTFDSA